MTSFGPSASPQIVSLETQASPRRRRKALFITCGVLLVLAGLLEFNPLHPIVWAHHFARDFRAGWNSAPSH